MRSSSLSLPTPHGPAAAKATNCAATGRALAVFSGSSAQVSLAVTMPPASCVIALDDSAEQRWLPPNLSGIGFCDSVLPEAYGRADRS